MVGRGDDRAHGGRWRLADVWQCDVEQHAAVLDGALGSVWRRGGGVEGSGIGVEKFCQIGYI